MTTAVKEDRKVSRPLAMSARRRVAWILIFIVDAGYVVWGGMAALFLNQLSGPGGKPILVAGYEGFTRADWSSLAPATASYMELLFRTYGAYNFVFGAMAIAITLTAFRRGESWAWWTLLIGNAIALLAAMTYDRTVNAIGPFEASEYLGLAMVFVACGLTAPFLAAERGGRAMP